MRNLFKESYKALLDVWNSKKKENPTDASPLIVEERPIINRIVYNSAKETCTVITPDGDTFVFQTVTPDNLIKYKTLPIEELLSYVQSEQEKFNASKINKVLEEAELEYTVESVKPIIDNTIESMFKDDSTFRVEEGKLYIRGINMPIPDPLVAVIMNFELQLRAATNVEIWDRIYTSFNVFLRFTLKLMANPIEANRNQLLEFVQRNNVQITYYGNLILYRRAYLVQDKLRDLKEFVREAYTKIKKQKKNPKKYTVYYHMDTPEKFQIIQSSHVYLKKFQDQNYILVNTLSKGETLSDLYDQYETEEVWFEPSHDRSMKFKLHDIYSIPEHKIELNPNLCHSGGLAK